MRGFLRRVDLARAVALVAVGAGLITGATRLPAPINLAQGTSTASAATTRADPVMQSTLVCPGPERLGVEGLPDSSAQRVSVAAVSAPAASLPSGFVTGQGDDALTISELPSGGELVVPVTVRNQVVRSRLSTAEAALVTGVGTLAPGTVATQWSWTPTGNSRGLVTTACIPAATSSWLIAGGAAPGRLEHLVLTNPGVNPVTVDVAVLGVQGRIDSPNGQGLVVAGRTRTVILVDTIAGSEQSPVVHVTAHGGTVAATLSDSWLDGVVPRGGDDVVSLTAPSREQVIAGVAIDGAAILRVAVPGESGAVVQTRVLTASGPKPLPANGVTLVAGGSVKDIDLGALPPGAYAVQVRADVPVVAAAMVERRLDAGAPSDLAWSVASPPIRTLAGMALPGSAVKRLTQRLDLAATGHAASVRVTTVLAGDRVVTNKVAIAADSVSTLSLDGATSVWITPLAGQVRAAVLTSVTDVGGELLSLTPLADLTLTATPLPLRQLRD